MRRKHDLKDRLMTYALHKWEVQQVGTSNALIYGYLEEKVYKQQPQCFNNTYETLVWNLNKSLYGLKQAARQ